jgi:hypothetical protein
MKSRIERLRQKIRKATGRAPVFASVESVLPFARPSKRKLFDLLQESGIELPRPRKLADRELAVKLWEVIHALLSRAIVIGNTDHLSDRELYALLYNETLQTEFVISPHHTVHIDMTKTGPDNGMPTYLKYYASEDQRQMYSEIYPEFEMPDHVDPPCRRDHLIPDVPPPLNEEQVN